MTSRHTRHAVARHERQALLRSCSTHCPENRTPQSTPRRVLPNANLERLKRRLSLDWGFSRGGYESLDQNGALKHEPQKEPFKVESGDMRCDPNLESRWRKMERTKWLDTIGSVQQSVL